MRSNVHHLLPLFLALGALAPACAADRPIGPAAPQWTGVAVQPRTTTEFDAAAWTRIAPNDAVVARVGGAPVTAAMIADVRKTYPDFTPRQALDRLVETEALAQEAMRQGLQGASVVGYSFRQALNRQWIGGTFAAAHGPDDIPLKRVQELYKIPQVRKQYDHAPTWRMAHLMFTCCDPKSEDCGRPEVVECFAIASEAIGRIYTEVKPLTEPVEGDADAVVQVMKDYRRDVESRYPELAYRDRAFYYDPAKTHEAQKGYNIITEVVARTITDSEIAVLQPPIQSPFGWHLLIKLDHIPESRKGPDDPGVVADIRANAFPMMKSSLFIRDIVDLRQAYNVQLDTGPLERAFQNKGPQTEGAAEGP